MFGFGMSAKEKRSRQYAETLMAPVAAASGQDVKILASQFFEETRAHAKIVNADIYSESMGDKLVSLKPEYVAKRVAAGLTVEDIRSFWNQPVIISAMQMKALELTDFMVMHVAHQQGKDMNALEEIARQQRKTMPKYGDPEKWNKSLPANRGFSDYDADMYFEFYLRVEAWREKTPLAVQEGLLAKFTSFNSMIRRLIADGTLA